MKNESLLNILSGEALGPSNSVSFASFGISAKHSETCESESTL